MLPGFAVVRRLLILFAVGLVAASGPGEARPATHSRASVAVLALPSSFGSSEITRETRDLAERIAASLRSAELRVVVAGLAHPAPLEEVSATASAAGVDLALGVWSPEPSGRCATVVAPPPTEPVAADLPQDQAELGRYLRQVMAFQRSRASARLSSALSSVGAWCHRKPSRVERYILDSVAAPTVVMSVGTRDTDSVAKRIPSVVDEWLAAESARRKSGGFQTDGGLVRPVPRDRGIE